MRIVLFVNSAKTFFWHRKPLADRLVREGHEVIVVCAKDGDVERFSNEAFKSIIIDMSRKGMNPLSEVLLIVKLIKILKKIKPDLCHNFTIKCVIYGSVAQRIAGVKQIINSITGLGYVFIKGGLIQTVVEKMYKISFKVSSSKIIFQNKDDHTLFLHKKITTISNSKLILGSGVNMEFFTPSPPPELPIKIVFAGRILKSKGIEELLQASIELNNSGIKHELFLAGEIDNMNPDTLSDTELSVYKTQSHIHFLGNVPDMRLIYKNSHIACLPSYREGLPKFLLEAMACGLPVVTTDVPGCREVVSNNGYLVAVKSKNSLRDALQKMIQNPEEMIHMGKRSRELVLEKFSEEKILSEILSLYK